MTIRRVAVVAALGGICAIGVHSRVNADARVQSTTTEPLAVARQYCRLAVDGARLTAKGRKQMADLGRAFDTTAPREAIVITTLEATSHTMVNDRQASIRIDSTYVGQLDLTTARLTREVPGLHGLDGFTMSLADGRWRIDSPQPAPYVGVRAAIRYVTELRDRATDASVRKNADRTLAALSQIRNAPGR